MKILITGASGSGTTTLAAHLTKELHCVHLDADDYYWKPTIPPFQEKVSYETRTARLTETFEAASDVVVSGSLVSWGDYWKSAFDLVVFIYLDPKVRLERLSQREIQRYGQQLVEDPLVKRNSSDFLTWAAKYDDPTFEGRSITVHRKWLSDIICPNIQVDGRRSIKDKKAKITSILRTI